MHLQKRSALEVHFSHGVFLCSQPIMHRHSSVMPAVRLAGYSSAFRFAVLGRVYYYIQSIRLNAAQCRQKNRVSGINVILNQYKQ